MTANRAYYEGNTELQIYNLLAKGLMIMIIYIFINAPITYYIGLICKEESRAKWYRTALRTRWWRGIAYICILMGILLTVSCFAGLAISGLFNVNYSIGYLVTLIIIYFVGTLAYMGYGMIIVEDKFIKGLSNLFAVGSKYYIKILFAMGAVVTYVCIVMLFTNVLEVGDVVFDSVAYELFDGALRLALFSFLSVYSILYYIKYRDMDDNSEDNDDNDEEKLTLADRIRKKYQ